MTDNAVLGEVFAKATSTGADFAELFFEDKKELCIKMRDMNVYNNAITQLHGAGLYVLSGTDSLYGYTNDTSKAGLLSLAEKLSQMIQGGTASFQKTVFSNRVYASPNQIILPINGGTELQKAENLRNICNIAQDYSTKIIDANGEYMEYEQNITIANTEGLITQETRAATTLRLYVTANDGKTSHQTWSNITQPMNFHSFAEKQVGQKQAQTLAHRASVMLEAEDVPSAYVPVIIDNGTLIHEACGHSLEGYSIAGGNSEFCGKLGQKVASEKVTIIDDGTISGLIGSNAIDDEGTPTHKNVLIENGILKSYMVDRLSSRKLNLSMTGSARRQSYQFAPCSRMTNTYLASGTDDEAEMIATISDGLYVKELGGGNINPLTGNFNLEVAEGYWIHNGQIQKPVKGMNLAGKGIEVLNKIDRVSPTVVWSEGGLCGASSGLVYVTASQPKVRISGLMVAGKGGCENE